jgi:hypothetical protein
MVVIPNDYRRWRVSKINLTSLTPFPFLSRLQWMAMESENKVRDGLWLRGYLCGGIQGCELCLHEVCPKTDPIDPQKMSQRAATHERTCRGAIKSRGNQGGRPPLDLHSKLPSTIMTVRHDAGSHALPLNHTMTGGANKALGPHGEGPTASMTMHCT